MEIDTYFCECSEGWIIQLSGADRFSGLNGDVTQSELITREVDLDSILGKDTGFDWRDDDVPFFLLREDAITIGDAYLSKLKV